MNLDYKEGRGDYYLSEGKREERRRIREDTPKEVERYRRENQKRG